MKIAKVQGRRLMKQRIEACRDAHTSSIIESSSTRFLKGERVRLPNGKEATVSGQDAAGVYLEGEFNTPFCAQKLTRI